MRSPPNSNRSSNPPTPKITDAITEEATVQGLASNLWDQIQTLAAAISVACPTEDAEALAHVWVSRLMVLIDLQTAGLLGQGDRWYLHNCLNRSQQTAADRFFQDVLYPLWHQGLALPAAEHSPAMVHRLGPLPHLGEGLRHDWPQAVRELPLALPDEPFERFLGWVAEQTWQRPNHRETAIPTHSVLAGAWEAVLARQEGVGYATDWHTLRHMRDRTIDAYLGQSLSLNSSADPPLEELLADLNDERCIQWVKHTLPTITVLDPACGSGRFLVMVLERLQQVYLACWHHAQRSVHPVLQDWVRSLSNSPQPPLWALTHRLLTQSIYGVDMSDTAIAIARHQLWHCLLATAPEPAALAPLPDLSLTLVPGNALIGFIQVNDASFDPIVPKRSQATPTEAAFQGNLLQPLTAAHYRDTLTEKEIRAEHYRAQTEAMAEATGIPDYAQAAFLRDRLDDVNQTTQAKLNRLLLDTCSQKLSLHITEPQPDARPRLRLLTADDIAALRPLHWGFSFREPLEAGGFHVILTHPPKGTLRLRPTVFYRQYADRFQAAGVDEVSFRRSPRSCLERLPHLAADWARQHGHLSLLKAYCLRSEDYQFSETSRTLSYAIAFSQRCDRLAHPDGVPPYVHLGQPEKTKIGIRHRHPSTPDQ